MPDIQDSAASQAAYWPIPILRAVPALAIGLFITFTASHAPEIGLLAFGVFAVVTGIIVVTLGTSRVTERVARINFIMQGVVAVIAGALALGFHGSGLGFLLYLITVFAALTGFLELYSGLRSRGRVASSRDWLFVGGFTAVLALVYLVIPPDTVVAVGILGAYGIILGVYLTIAGLSLRWSDLETQRPERTTGTESGSAQ